MITGIHNLTSDSLSTLLYGTSETVVIELTNYQGIGEHSIGDTVNYIVR
jgi:hypothetical protein